MAESSSQISEWLDFLFSYGSFWVYAVILAACFIENLFPPFPGDSFIVAAGGLVALQRLDLVTTFLVISGGGLSSVMILYLLGRRFGRDYFIRKNYNYFSSSDIVAVEQRFQKWGALILIFSRFVVGARTALALAAGISFYNPLKMLIYSFISYFLFAGLLMYIAIKLVENFDVVAKYIRTYNYVLWPLVVGLLVWYLVQRRMSLRKAAKQLSSMNSGEQD